MNLPADSWVLADMPDQDGRTVVVTGCTRGGLGYHTALELARRGARVVLAGRTPAKVEEAEGAILAEVPRAELERLEVDLADLGSVRRAAARAAAYGPLDALVNNAGVMAPPYSRTADGFELQLATNHLGPFLLTGLLLPQLSAAQGGSRVVTVSSQMHRVARKAPLGDPREEPRRYSRWLAYSETKLANLLFAFELDRRCRAAELPVKGLAAHPGFSGTHLAANGRYGSAGRGRGAILDAAIKVVSQSAHDGALPVLMATTADLPGSTYCGPGGPGEAMGAPRVVGTRRLARSESAARELWEISERAVGLAYPDDSSAT